MLEVYQSPQNNCAGDSTFFFVRGVSDVRLTKSNIKGVNKVSVVLFKVMEGINQGERSHLSVEVASESDIDTLIAIEKSIPETKTYSSMLNKAEWIEEMIHNKIFLLKRDGVVVGSVAYEIKSPEHLYISGVVVRPEYQGKGIAREALTNILKEYADTQRIDLVTHPGNPALELYQSLGFEIESRSENHFGDGEPRLTLVCKKNERRPRHTARSSFSRSECVRKDALNRKQPKNKKLIMKNRISECGLRFFMYWRLYSSCALKEGLSIS